MILLHPELCTHVMVAKNKLMMSSFKGLNRIIFVLLGCYPSVGYTQIENNTQGWDTSFYQPADSVEIFEEVSALNPQRAAMLAAALPGLGQIYNKQYWKVPIVVSGFIIFAHFINYNNQRYHAFRNAAILMADNDPNTLNPYLGFISNQETLVRNRDKLRRDRDYLTIIAVLFYALQIVDAHVSAHLNEFEVNPRLTFSLLQSPASMYHSKVPNLSLIINF